MERKERIVHEAPPAAVDFGDLNIQFPDTLVQNPCAMKRFVLTDSLALEETPCEN